MNARIALVKVSEGVWPAETEAAALQAQWAQWAQALRAHAAWEDAVVYPWVRTQLSTDHAHAMGQEMAQRRGVR
ncbi:hypothetical protein [Ideonella paludis]|uniref:hypothetical protein n=1 Tax=Ideonella paludis TaxID=1233411 RepID=UPI003635023A